MSNSFILNTTIKVYQIIIPQTKVSGWGAKGIVFTLDGKLETEEVYANTKEDVQQKSQKALEELIKRIST